FEPELAKTPLLDFPLLAAGLDLELVPVARLHPRLDAEGGVGREVLEAREVGSLVSLDWRLWMGLEEIVALAAELRDDIVTFEPVQVADAPAPVGQVDGVLQGRGGDLYGGRRGWPSFGELGRGGARRSGSFGGGLGGPQRRGPGTGSG